jgi:Bacterial Ig-like domain
MIPINRKISLFFVLSGLFIFIGCASKRAPGGGPQDKTPPEIIFTFPSPDSTGVKNLVDLKISFSESIDESSINNSIFISPPIEFKPEWKSDVDLEIHLSDSLKPGQTYVVVIGASVKDLRSNKLAESFQLAFSTGDKIDHGRISGKVYGVNKNQSYSIFAFSSRSDTMNFVKNKPEYISQTGKDGKFLLNYLKLGRYRVFAVDDQNNNLIIDADFEKIGLPYTDVILDSSDFVFAGLNYRTTKIDTLAPRLNSVRPIHNRQINLRLSEPIVIQSKKQVSIRDSISGSPVSILAISQNLTEKNTLEIYTSPMDSGKVYTSFIKSFSDSSLNMGKDTSLSFTAPSYQQQDTFQVVTLSPKDSLWDAHPSINFYFEVNNPLDKKSLIDNLILTWQNGDTVQGTFHFPSAFEAEFRPEANLTLDSIYTFTVNLSKIKNVWGDSLLDSLNIRHIKINNGDDYGEIAGNVAGNNPALSNVFVRASEIGKKKSAFTTKIDKKNAYKLDYLPEGIYRLSAFVDVDSNAVYSAGGLFPFSFSEPFVVGSDSVKVRKRWETSGIRLTLPVLQK